MILVLGATGRAGREVVRALLEQGAAVRAFVRDPERARRLLGEAPQLAAGDLADPRAVRAALSGAEQVVLSCADDPRRVGWETAAIDAAAAAGVRRIVKLSSVGAEPGSPVAFWDWHGRIEEHLRRREVPSVVLRSGPYMSNVLDGAESVAREDRLFAPAGAARTAMVDPRDVGRAAAAVLGSSGHGGRTHVLTGPAALSHAEVAAGLSAATGREISYVPIPDAAAREAMVACGLPEAAADRVLQVFAALRRGAGEHVTPAMEMLTGAPPRSFAAWARDHAHRFAPVAVGAGR